MRGGERRRRKFRSIHVTCIFLLYFISSRVLRFDASLFTHHVDDDEKLISITHKRCLLQNALLFSSLSVCARHTCTDSTQYTHNHIGNFVRGTCELNSKLHTLLQCFRRTVSPAFSVARSWCFQRAKLALTNITHVHILVYMVHTDTCDSWCRTA